MYNEEEDIREWSSLSPSRREAEAECKHINCMQHAMNPNTKEDRAERQRRERSNITRDEPSEGPKVLKYLDHPHHHYQIVMKI